MLIALAGLSGAGKSTAIGHLTATGFGTAYYAGSIVHDEIASRKLAFTPDNERLVRTELRRDCGIAVFAERAIPRLKHLCDAGHVLLDAVYCPQELELYRAAFNGRIVTVAVIAPFELRAVRAGARPDRPLPPEKLQIRDEYEIGTLRLDAVLAVADWHIANERSLDEFKQALDDFATGLC